MKSSILLLIVCIVISSSGCKKETNWATGTESPVISILDLREIIQGEETVLTQENMAGAYQVSGIVISDYANGNVPEGTVVIQNTIDGRTIRGISVSLGVSAADYLPGDSLLIAVDGATIKREAGRMLLTAVDPDAVTILSQDNVIHSTTVTVVQLLTAPQDYESTLVNISTGSFVPDPTSGETIQGDKFFNDGTGEVVVHTESTASFSSDLLPISANISGILMGAPEGGVGSNGIYLWPRAAEDIKERTLILAWNLLGAIGNEETSTSTIMNVNLEESILSRGPGLAAVPAGASYASTFPMGATRDETEMAGSYYEFTITPKPGAVVSLSALDVILRIQTSAPRTYIWTYSLDGGISLSDIGTPRTWTTNFDNNNGIQEPQIDLSVIPDLQEISQPVVFRLYAWGGGGSGASGFRIGKSLSTEQHALAISGNIVESASP